MGVHKNPKLVSRNSEIIDLFKYGFYPQEIGDLYSITRERVRQILKQNNINLRDGGSFLSSKKRKQKKIKDRKDRIYKQYGCSLELYNELRGDGCYSQSPVFKFRKQKLNSKQRGLEWNLTLDEWWSLWKDKFHKRGKFKGQYVMSRYGDSGPYSIDNVEVVTCTENIIESYEIRFGGDYSETLKNRHATSRS